jgi:hypothetical protein
VLFVYDYWTVWWYAENICQQIGDVAWDPTRERYIFMLPWEDKTLASRPMAVTGNIDEIVWFGNGQSRPANNYNGVTSQLRVIGDSLFVLGYSVAAVGGGPSIYEYSAIDGEFIGLRAGPDGTAHGAAACDGTCTNGVGVYAAAGGLFTRQFDKPGQIQLAAGDPGEFSPSALMWRSGDEYFATSVQHGPDGSTFRTHILTAGVGWTVEDELVMGKDEYFEPTIIETDDGYLVAASAFPYTDAPVPDDFRDIRVQGWNIAFDGTIRGTFTAPEHAHSPRLAYKQGRVALTYVTLHEDEEAFEARKLMFFDCMK